tara:strand:+ start:602 stop:1279 length:678 start_codon:yes stop_codon:yes gene_type:complete
MEEGPPSFLKGQILHLGSLLIAIPVLSSFVEIGKGSLLGIPLFTWFWLCISIPIAHQIYVWACWRMELRGQLITKKLGPNLGFTIYLIGFFILFGSRFLTLLFLAIADKGSISLPLAFQWIIGAPLVIIGGYGMYSIKTYFGFQRAAGIDHFDPSYRDKPLVRQGIFRWTQNAMYVFVIQLTWIFGVLGSSKLAMIGACFQTCYIWIHYFGTEKPDMNWIYGQKS